MYQDTLKFVADNQLAGLLWIPLLWAILGGVVGLLLGLCSFFTIRALGGYRLEWKGATWLRVLVGVLTVAVAVICGGITGFQEGIWRAVQRVALQGKMSEQLQPQIGQYGAMLIAGVYVGCPQGGKQCTEEELKGKVKSFTTGAWELDVPEFNRRLLNTPANTANVLIESATKDTRLRCPELQDTKASRMALWFLGKLGESMLPGEAEEAHDSLVDNELGKLCRKIIREMPAEAAKHGDPNTISYAEVSAFIGRKGMVSAIIKPIRAMVRSQQYGNALFFLCTLALPVIGFRIAEHVRRRKTVTEPAATEPTA
ncbi:MAG: hypothetical protein ACYDBB_04585 [Armatimonadota bacterium]